MATVAEVSMEIRSMLATAEVTKVEAIGILETVKFSILADSWDIANENAQKEEIETSMEGGADDVPAPSQNTKPPANDESSPTTDNIHELPEGKALVGIQVPAKDDPAWDELGLNEYEVETMDKHGTHYRVAQYNVWCTPDGEYVYSDAPCFLKPICTPVMIVALIKEFGTELVMTKYPKIEVLG